MFLLLMILSLISLVVVRRYMVMLYLSKTDEYCIQEEKTINQCYFDFSEFVKYIDLAR